VASDGVLIALGGNAFAPPGERLSHAGQQAFALATARALLPLLRAASRALLVHGNGPQVGEMLTRVEVAGDRAYALPLDACVAAVDGELGYDLSQALYNVLRAAGDRREICSVLTQVEIDPQDPAFALPDKPVGRFHAAHDVAALRAQGQTLVEDAGRGYRRVVPSPKPQAVIERDVIARLVAAGVLVIAGGGGGIPVQRRAGLLVGVEAVVDKDHTSALLADALDLTLLVLLTDVAAAFTDHGTAAAREIRAATPAQLEALTAAGHFAPGSMLPKITAASAFAGQPGRRAIICSPDNLDAALAGEAGTTVRLAAGSGP